MELRVLGPVELVTRGSVLPIAQPQQCAVLAALVAEAGRLIPVQILVDRVWGPDPPPRARRTLHTYITRVRRLLEQADDPGDKAARLVYRTGGYVLEIDPDRVDLHRFRQLCDRTREPGCSDEQRVMLLSEALALWRGEPLTGLPGQWAARVRERWEQQRQDAVLAWAQAQLHVGNPTVVIPVLTDLIGENPLVEPLTAALMRALHAAGRRAEALDRYTATRRRLVEDLGVDPGTELQAVHQAILRDEPDRAGHAATSRAGATIRAATLRPTRLAADPLMQPPPAAPPPAQLPRDISDFTGRAAQVGRLGDLLAQTGPTPTVVSIVGKPGVGKTALANHVAHQVQPRFPDGQMYASLGAGQGQPSDPADVLAGFLRAFGVPGPDIPGRLDERSALYRSLLAGRRVLAVLDDARDEAQVRPLLPGQPPSAVVVTGRQRLVGLEDATVIELGLLRPEETRDLLGRIVGAGRIGAEPVAAARLGDQCGHLPLAVRICGARAAARPEMPLADLAGLLADEKRRLFELSAGDLDVRSSLALSYRALSEPQRRVFRLLGLLTTPDSAAWLAAALLDREPADAEELLCRLVDAHLLDVAGRDDAGQVRYRLHDLLRLYAGERAAAEEPEQARSAALRRAVTAAATEAELQTNDLRAGAHAVWLAAEQKVLVALVEQSFQNGCAVLGWRLAATLESFFEAAGQHDDWEHTQRLALAAAVAAGDVRQEALARGRLAAVLWLTDRWQEAQQEAEECLPRFRELAEPREEARALRTLGRVLHEQGHWDRAVACLSESCDILVRLGDWHEVACTLRDLGMRHRFRDDTKAALDCLQRSLSLYQSVGEPREAAWTGLQLGCAYRDQGRLTVAEDQLRRCLAALQAFAEPAGQVQALFQLAVTHRRQGRRDEAARCLRISLIGARRLGQRLGEGMILLNLAEIHIDQTSYRTARHCLYRSLAIFQELGSPYWQGRAHACLGRMLAAAGQQAAARTAWRQALRLLQPLGAPEADAIADLLHRGPQPDSGRSRV
jgi:DNA-binding SARP family transcriptional activator/tetratricopeptide (TPR) repeat protein